MNKKLILTAVNNNDTFWHDNFIPFLISLRNTDFDGDIGVLSCGLSADKISALTRNNILVFDCLTPYRTIYLDRHYTVGMIAEHYGYTQIALYDADIWFPSHNLTLFSQLIDENKLYAAYDLAYPDFVERVVLPHKLEDVSSKMQVLLDTNKAIWQVGVIAGSSQAWIRHHHYLDNLMSRNWFKLEYGVDTTAFNLYSVEENGVARISEKYNCIPNHQRFTHTNLLSTGKKVEYTYYVNDEKVEGLHITTPELVIVLIYMNIHFAV